MGTDKVKIEIYAPNLPKKEFIGVLYIELNESTDRIYISELPKQPGFRPPEIEVLISNERNLMTKFFQQLFNVANKIGGTKAVVRANKNIIYDFWFNPLKSRPDMDLPSHLSELKVEIY